MTITENVAIKRASLEIRNMDQRMDRKMQIICAHKDVSGCSIKFQILRTKSAHESFRLNLTIFILIFLNTSKFL